MISTLKLLKSEGYKVIVIAPKDEYKNLVKEYVDENLLGGFILRVGDREFNASASNKLQKLKREFLSNPYIKEY